MLGFLFGFNGRVGRVSFFLGTIAIAVLMTAICFAIAAYAFQNVPKAMIARVAPWEVIVPVALLFGFLTFTLQSMRLRDIGWDPVCVIPGWFALAIVDRLIATHIPAVSFGHNHHGTIVGALANLALFLALMFWPGAEYESKGPSSGEWLRSDNPRGSDSEPAASSRIARVAGGEFGHRA